MQFPERFSNLPEYAFPRLRSLLDAHEPGGDVLHMTIGEPRTPFPGWVGETIAAHAAEFGRYPPNDGTPELLVAIAGWIAARYGVSLDPATQVFALNGTREGLFNAALTLVPETKNGQRPAVLIPNPFYQVYAVGTLAAAAEPVFVNATAANGFLPRFDELDPALLDRTALVYVCSPSNPQGAVADRAYWRALIAAAERHDFVILADECYAEIYRHTAPDGALAACAELGADPDRVVSFHSLSKRSGVPGLRSGFAAGGARAIAALKQLRAYAGAPLPLPLQRAATRLWQDEDHVSANRAIYNAKFDIADRVLGDVPGYSRAEGGFFLWLPVDDGEATALRLWTTSGVRVLPGAYLSRDTAEGNPGKGYIRVALVAEDNDIERGLTAIRDVLTEGRS